MNYADVVFNDVKDDLAERRTVKQIERGKGPGEARAESVSYDLPKRMVRRDLERGENSQNLGGKVDAEYAKRCRYDMWRYLLETRASFETDDQFSYWCDVSGITVVVVNEDENNEHDQAS